MNGSVPPLSPRLSKIAELIGSCVCLADIGTDHAYLPVFMCLSGRAQCAIASDIRRGPLKRAADTVRAYHANDKISLRLGAGLETLAPDEADAVVIAGMGGILISNILDDSADKLSSADKIILQPMTAVPELREYLWQNRWSIESEVLAREEDKIYNILTVCPPTSDTPAYKPTAAELYLGKALIENRPEYFTEYLHKKRVKLEKMLRGLKRAASAEAHAKAEYCAKLLSEIDKIQ